MEIKTQFSDCGCAILEDDLGEKHIQPALGCDVEHDWGVILAGLRKPENQPLFEIFDA